MAHLFPKLENTGSKIFLGTLLLLILLSFIFCLFIPHLLSTPWGKTQVMNVVNNRIKGNISVHSIELQWMGTQKIEGLIIKDDQDKTLLNISNLKIDNSLIHLVLGVFKGPFNFEIDANIDPQMLIEQLKIDDYSKIAAVVKVAPSELFEPIFINLNGAFTTDSKYNLKLEKTVALISTSYPTLHGLVPIEGKLSGNVHLVDWMENGNFNFDKAQIKADINLQDFPTPLLVQFSGMKILPKLIGNSLSLNLDYAKGSHDTQDPIFDVQLNGEGIQINNTLKLGKEVSFLSQDKPAQIHYTLTPERFSILQSLIASDKLENKFILTENSHISAHINSLNFTHTDSFQKPSLKMLAGRFHMYFHIDQLRAEHVETHEAIRLDKIHTALQSQDIKRDLKLELEAIQKDKAENASPISLKADIKDLFSPDGSINHEHLSLNFDVNAKKFPASSLLQFLSLDFAHQKLMEVVIGSTFDIDSKATYNNKKGIASLNIEGPNGHINLETKLENRVATLTTPLTAELKVTPELGQYVLEDIVPILSGMISAENTVKVTIDPTGFSYPIDSQNFKAVEVGLMTIDLGRMVFNKSGQLETVMTLLKANVDNLLSVWFTPIYLAFHKGKIELQRFDMLAMDKYPLACWGSVDFLKDYIHLTIGLKGKSLQNVVKVPLGKSYMLQLPYKGKIGNAHIDKTKLTAQIAALLSAATATPQGLGLGALIGLASGTFTDPSPPSPTTQPFPWEE